MRPQNHQSFWKNVVAVSLIHCLFQSGTNCVLCTIPSKLIDARGKPGKSLLHPILRVPWSKTFNNCPDGEYIFSFLFLYVLLLQFGLLLGSSHAVDFLWERVTFYIVTCLPYCSRNAISEFLLWNVPVNGKKSSKWILAAHTPAPCFIIRVKSASSQSACVQPYAVMTFVLCPALVAVLYNLHRYSLRLHSFLGYMTNTEISNRF